MVLSARIGARKIFKKSSLLAQWNKECPKRYTTPHTMTPPIHHPLLPRLILARPLPNRICHNFRTLLFVKFHITFLRLRDVNSTYRQTVSPSHTALEVLSKVSWVLIAIWAEPLEELVVEEGGSCDGGEG
jgi:hypothetical protein